MKSQNRHYTQSELLRRGWTPKTIEDLLPTPTLKKNPMYRSASPMKCWDVETVEAAEQDQRFIAGKEKKLRRQLSTQKATETKKEKFFATVSAELEKVKVDASYSEERLKKAAVRHHAEFQAQRGNYNYFGLNINIDYDTLQRWMVNFVRHQLTDYDCALYSFKGSVGISDGYCIYKNGVLDKIAEAYPFLSIECENQKVITEYLQEKTPLSQQIQSASSRAGESNFSAGTKTKEQEPKL